MEATRRGPVDAAAGLTSAEVDERRAAGLTNDVEDPSSRSFADIARANIFTPFNLLLGILLVVILAVREYKDALFGIVLVANAAIGIVQEVRAKRSLDRLAVLNAPTALVRRDGAVTEIPSRELVRDDVIELRLGDQIAVDGSVLSENGLEVDESLLTGEADPVAKDVGEDVRSGSFVVAGSGAIRATAVGAEAYAFKLSSEARRFSLVKSELRTGINRVITLIGWLMIPTAILLVSAQLSADIGVVEAVQGSVAGLVAMVPEGLVLLTSIAFAVGATRLARKQVLTQELAAIEGLARVDVICLDKTGTLTEGSLTLATVDVLAEDGGTGGTGGDGSGDGTDPAEGLAALGGADDHPNPSLAAIVTAYDRSPGWPISASVPFSSARKWSAATFEGHGTWFLGAPDILLGSAEASDATSEAADRLDRYSRDGRRVLMLASSPAGLTGDALPGGLRPVALVVLDEQVRESAPATIAYFGEQGVTVKVISGDSPVTVGAVAQRVGVPGASEAIDARTLPDDIEALADVLEEHSVFGRVTPQQKRSMVHALQSRGHTVAMTGDGVNDTLALKDADIGVAMGTGSPAARAVARFVLLANDFSVFPSVVAEGRRVIANVERVANLFLTKTFYAVVLALATGIFRLPFPFLPRHFTIISALTIGIPGFFLALAPNARLARPGFLTRVLRFAIPAGIVAGISTFGAYLIARDGTDTDLETARTVAVIVLFVIALWVLAFLSRPLLSWRGIVVLAMAGLFVGACSIGWFSDYFRLELPGSGEVLASVALGAVAGALLQVGWHLSGWAPPPATADHD